MKISLFVLMVVFFLIFPFILQAESGNINAHDYCVQKYPFSYYNNTLYRACVDGFNKGKIAVAWKERLYWYKWGVKNPKSGGDCRRKFRNRSKEAVRYCDEGQRDAKLAVEIFIRNIKQKESKMWGFPRRSFLDFLCE